MTHIRVAGSPIRLRQADHLKLQRVLETDLFQRPFLFYYRLNSVLCKMQGRFLDAVAFELNPKYFLHRKNVCLYLNKIDIFLENFSSVQIFGFKSAARYLYRMLHRGKINLR